MTASIRTRAGHPRVVVVHGVAHVGELAYRDTLEGWTAGPGAIEYVPAV